jgi:hypothetical protein
MRQLNQIGICTLKTGAQKVMDIEEHGSFYLHRQTIEDADGRVTEYFDVGHIIDVEGRRIYKVNSDAGFSSRAEALQWIQRQNA